MYVVVLLLGLAAAVAGVAAVGFGLSIHEFSLGNALLIAGTTAFIGGLVMVAIAGAIRELRRIGEALSSRSAPRFPRPGEPFDPYAPGVFRPPVGTPRMPAAPMPMPPPGAPEAPGPSQPVHAAKFEAATAAAEPARQPTEPPSSGLQPRTGTAAEASTVVDEAETIPLSPEEHSRTFDRFDERRDTAAHQLEPDPYRTEHGPEPGDVPTKPVTPEPPAGRGRRSPFDAIWPPRDRAPVPRDAGEAAPGPDDRAAEDATAPAPPATSEVNQPDLFPTAETPTVPEADAGAAPPEPHAVSILKSGVVDGMAYTLYSDGSIEAELPSGTIRFASISELREHLEKTE